MTALKEFASSIFFIVSMMVFAVSAYLLYWTVIMPGLFGFPFLISVLTGFVFLFISKKL